VKEFIEYNKKQEYKLLAIDKNIKVVYDAIDGFYH
jgi:hypothetical protein